MLYRLHTSLCIYFIASLYIILCVQVKFTGGEAIDQGSEVGKMEAAGYHDRAVYWQARIPN